MSSSSRRSNNDHSAPRGSGRSPNSVRRTSSQPPQPFQPQTVSGTHNSTAGGVPWTNRPPSNLQGSAPGQAQHLYANPSGDDWDYLNLTSQLTGSTQLQPTSSHQLQIAVPELYPSTSAPTSSGQYVNPQSGDRGRRYQRSTTWSGDSHDLSLSLQPLSPLPQPQTTSVSPNVLYTTPQYPQTPNRGPQNYPPQRRPQQQQPPSPPRPQNNVPSLSQPQVSPNTSQGAPLYATQYNSPPSSSQQYTGTHSSNYGIGHPPVARPPPNQNRRDASIRPTGPGEGRAIPNDWGYRSGDPDTLSVSATLRTAPKNTPQNAPQNAPRLHH
ncbi:hypothetical protein EDB86DRAFT_746651 [Lactarius hatsudake]|nr:hypothetical protein EDB86DRAFT_746651 [Lactarius hatsudake]